MITQVNGVYADIHQFENLYNAYRQAARGKRGRAPAAAFEFRLEDNLVRLQEELTLRLHWLSIGQYDHASHAVAELGRLLGSWLKRTRKELA